MTFFNKKGFKTQQHDTKQKCPGKVDAMAMNQFEDESSTSGHRKLLKNCLEIASKNRTFFSF